MMKKKAAIFISGGGSNMLALIEAAKDPAYPVEFVAVISDKKDAGGLAKAEARGIRTAAFERKDYDSKEAHESAILEFLAGLQPDFLCLAGYMRLLTGKFISAYENRIVNIHPSLLPLFRGLHTHQRAIEAGMKVAGCTVHYVTEGMDEGPIIAQAAIPILDGDTSDTLAARVLTAEHRIYRDALKKVAGGILATDDTARVISFG
ncbi:phosphoribosylglycinamide formyltransferase [Rhizobium sp. KVB221]|uniref:Phosphoribosylglycinamide formyltransferase n=1 Tax=Rhizobium setariae TaxID=2801340 RepID=A0A936YNB4_9HYPH|nr:phosphoribosylglycinamide formyltransferase [Rhizobium setariae]MBL0371284.1 phosphoribosylglycinamide formyltransferase [Rhizobium setariae]